MRHKILIAGVAEADSGLFCSLDVGIGTSAATISCLQDGQSPSSAALSSTSRSMELVGFKSNQIDFLISSTQTPDFNNPGLVSLLLSKYGINIPGLEIRHAGAGPLYALDIACQLIETGQASRILVSGCDLLSRYFSDLHGSAQLGVEIQCAQRVCADGAASFLVLNAAEVSVDSGPVFSVLGTQIGGYSAGAMALTCPCPSSSQFPLRLTKENIEQHQHRLHLYADKFLGQFDQRMVLDFESFLAANDILREDISHVVAHGCFSGMSQKLLELLNLGQAQVKDVFADRGYIGAAGVISGLAATKSSADELLLLIGVTSGPVFGFTALRQV